jgi:hypothetical protein
MKTEMGDILRRKLKEASKGEPETWGFVAMFMQMIEEAEQEMAKEDSDEVGGSE